MALGSDTSPYKVRLTSVFIQRLAICPVRQCLHGSAKSTTLQAASEFHIRFTILQTLQSHMLQRAGTAGSCRVPTAEEALCIVDYFAYWRS